MPAHPSFQRCFRGFFSLRSRSVRLPLSLPLPSPPAEQATTRDDQAGQASTGDGTGDGDPARLVASTGLLATVIPSKQLRGPQWANDVATQAANMGAHVHNAA
jgi:hypothetical protein